MQDVTRESQKNLFTVISTFSGAGGSSVGYKLSGGNVLVANEFVNHAFESYRLNHKDQIVLTDDIKNLSGDDFLNCSNLKPTELDIFDGSPPCTHFSVSGKREKSWNKVRIYHGHSQFQIENLTLEMLRIANDLQPKVVIIENVKGLTYGKASLYLNKFKVELNKIGYLCLHRVLNASYYGVPQNRERTFIIGIRRDVAEKLDIHEIQLSNLLFPKQNREKVILKDAFCGLDKDENYIPECELRMNKIINGNCVVRETLRKIPKNPEKPVKFSKVLRKVAAENINDPKFAKFNGRDSYFNYVRFSWKTPAPTLTGNCRTHFHPDEDRTFTISELIRIMSLPDDYKFAPGSLSDVEERIGLMVAPLMMRAISDNLYHRVIKPYNELIC